MDVVFFAFFREVFFPFSENNGGVRVAPSEAVAVSLPGEVPSPLRGGAAAPELGGGRAAGGLCGGQASGRWGWGVGWGYEGGEQVAFGSWVA